MKSLLLVLSFVFISFSPARAESTLVCLGDSLTAGLGLGEEQSYPSLVQAGLPGWKVVNAGVSGDTTAGGLKRLDWILKSRPEAVFVCLGANDGLRGMDPVQTEKNLESILRRILASGAKAYLAGMLVPSNYGPDYAAKFRALYPRLAKRLGVPLMPFLLEGVGGVARLNQADGMHPTAEGAQLIARHVLAFLRPRLPQPKSGPAAAQPKIIRSKKDL